MLNDTLAMALAMVNNHEKLGNRECIITPVSKVTKKVMSILNEQGFVGSSEEMTAARGAVYKVNLLGKINKCGVVKPRFSVTVSTIEKFEKRYLPAKNVGVLIVSTSQGLLTHEEAKERKIGGRLLAYCY